MRDRFRFICFIMNLWTGDWENRFLFCVLFFASLVIVKRRHQMHADEMKRCMALYVLCPLFFQQFRQQLCMRSILLYIYANFIETLFRMHAIFSLQLNAYLMSIGCVFDCPHMQTKLFN